MRALVRFGLALLVLIAPGVAPAQVTTVALRFNPFAAPDLTANEREPDVAASDDADAWSPVLTATLAAGDESFANLGGVVLEIGQETHGYRLREVRMWEAVFEKDGEALVIEVETREQDEQP